MSAKIQRFYMRLSLMVAQFMIMGVLSVWMRVWVCLYPESIGDPLPLQRGPRFAGLILLVCVLTRLEREQLEGSEIICGTFGRPKQGLKYNLYATLHNAPPASASTMLRMNQSTHQDYKYPTDDYTKALARSQKGHIWAAIACSIFEDDKEYKDMYAEDNHKFALAVCNHFGQLVLVSTHLMPLVQKTFEGNLAFMPKTISSVPSIDHTSNLAALTKGGSKDKQAAPPPDHSGLTGDTEIDLIIEDEVIDDTIDKMLDLLLTQGKGKEKALSPPSTNELMVEEPSSDDMDCSSHIPYVEPSIPNTAFDNVDDNMGMQDWDDMGVLEDNNTIQSHLSKKHPYSSPSPPPNVSLPSPSHGKFQMHADCAINHSAICSPKPPSSLALSSALSLCSHSCTSSMASCLSKVLSLEVC
ncbi:hypothetical protein EDD22DRAFT_850112 [Suillus occidentalis]|nr:hypothetical protein EDD22DRAFT_850112 [Suillus occidentalis]